MESIARLYMKLSGTSDRTNENACMRMLTIIAHIFNDDDKITDDELSRAWEAYEIFVSGRNLFDGMAANLLRHIREAKKRK